ncbi:uncharacterized protein LOC102372030, partial [Alligator sinensis]|uniref:Uncharacterized protein LOC102372030 n=1 Tax=Alligator sinensis TaxID=38654 RepID=A0A1U7SC51_ALLSI
AKENTAAGPPPMRCPFYEEMDCIMRGGGGNGGPRATFFSDTGDVASGLEMPEGTAASERWGLSRSWVCPATASRSWGPQESGACPSRAQAALGEVCAVRVKEEETSGEELPPEPDPSVSAGEETELAPRRLTLALDRLAQLRVRKRKAREEGPAEAARGSGPKHGRSHLLELKRARRASAWRAEERQSLAEFMQHDREMRLEERDFQAQLLEQLLQRQLEALQAVVQAPAPASAPQERGEQVQVEGVGTGLQFQALLEQAVRDRGHSKDVEVGTAELWGEPGAAGKAPVPAQYWTADEILRWLVPQQPVNGQQPRCQEGSQDLRLLPSGGSVPTTVWGVGGKHSAEVKGADEAEGGVEAPTAWQRFLGFRYEAAAGPRAAYGCLQELCWRWLQPEVHSKEQVLERLVLEQFLSLLPERVQRWVRERCPKSGPEAVGLAEDFLLPQRQARQLQPQVLEPPWGGAEGPGAAEQVLLGQGQRETDRDLAQEDRGSAGPLAPDLRGHAAPRVYAGGLGTAVGRRSRAAPGRSRLVKNGLESPPGERGPEELQAAAGQSLELRGASWGQNARATWGAAARGGHMDRAEPPADRTSSPCGRPPRCPSPEADGPLPRADPGSPWEVDGSTEGRAEGSAACPGGQSQCQGCTVLRAQLEAAQEELQVARASPLLGLSGAALRDLQAALGTISRVMSERRPPGAKAPRDVAQSPGALLPADTHVS